MSERESFTDWKYHHIGILVTGKGEERFLPNFMRSLMESGKCAIEVIRRIPQRSARTSPRRKLRMVNTGKSIPDKDEDEIGLPARQYLSRNGSRLVVLVDDLEDDRRNEHSEIYKRYRIALDALLNPAGLGLERQASVHFFVNMIEAYYFADPQSIVEVMGGDLPAQVDDVEEIRHPKNDLKKVFNGFDEVEHGERISQRINLPLVLSNPRTCASLRTLVKWCVLSMHQTLTDKYQLAAGVTHPVTNSQIPVSSENESSLDSPTHLPE